MPALQRRPLRTLDEATPRFGTPSQRAKASQQRSSSKSKAPAYEETTELPVFVAKEVGEYLSARAHHLDKSNWYASVKRGMDRGELKMLKVWRNEAAGNGAYLRQLGLNTLLAFGPKPQPQAQPTSMGWWGVAGKHGGSSSYGSSKKLPDPVYSPDEKKLREMAHKLGEVSRLAAGGIVIKNFDAPNVWDLEVVVSKVAPKYGSYFVFPKGGQDPGEHVHKTAAREVYEEAGVRAKVANSRSFATKSKFSDRGKYDLVLVMNLLKKKFPKDAEFIDKNEDRIHDMYFKYENTTHYFVMRHTGGKPRQGAGKGHGAAEMAYSEWIPLGEALKRSPRLGGIVKGLFPVIRAMWEKKRPKPKKKKKKKK